MLPKYTTINELRIIWKYNPKLFKIHFLKEDMRWMAWFEGADSGEGSMAFQFNHMNIWGV
jgi:hypothetical protein